MKTTCPSKRPTSAFLASIGFEVLVERNIEGVVDDVGRDHEGTERGECHDGFFVEKLPQRSVNIIGDEEGGVAKPTGERQDDLLASVELEIVGILARVN